MNPPSSRLDVHDHSRDSAGMRYVYPVVSRRAGGVSVGINLNTNNACNWRCVYCQVPGLSRGGPAPVDVMGMATELRALLDALLHGDFMARRVPPEARRLSDVAFSGNGEPTQAKEFPAAVDAVIRVLDECDLLGTLPVRLITNGSGMSQARVRDSLPTLAAAAGEVWFKLDAGTAAGFLRSNDTVMQPASVQRRLSDCAARCPTWVQTCVYARGGVPSLDREELDAYLHLLAGLTGAGIRGVHLYTVARKPALAGSEDVEPVDAARLETIAAALGRLGLPVRVSP